MIEFPVPVLVPWVGNEIFDDPLYLLELLEAHSREDVRMGSNNEDRLGLS